MQVEVLKSSPEVNPEIQTQPKKPNPSDNLKFLEIKTDSFVMKFFLSVGSLLILIPIIRQILSLFLYRSFSKEKKQFLSKIENKKITTIKSIADELKAALPNDEISQNKKVIALLKELEPKKIHSVSVQKHLKEIYESNDYQELKVANPDHPLVVYMEILSTSLRTNIIGMDIFAEYGHSILQNQKNLQKDHIFSWHEVGNCMVDAFNHRPCPTFDSTPAMAFSVLSNFSSFPNWFAAAGLFGKSPVKDFNPYRTGNFNLATLDYDFGAENIRFFHGPGPGITSDRMLSLHLDELKKGEGIHLQHSMEYAKKKSELERLNQIKSYEENSSERMHFYATPVDGDPWHMKNDFKDFKSSTEFINKYKQLALGQGDDKAYRGLSNQTTKNSGFYVGPDVMSDEQFEGIFDLAAEIFDEESFKNNPYAVEMMAKGDSGKRVLAKGLQIFIQSLISVGALAKLSEDSKAGFGPLSFGQACTEDIDRGAVVNVATRLLMMKLSDTPITDNELKEMVGTIFGRAELSNGRRIMQDRFEGLTAFLFLLGSHESEASEKIREHLQNNFFNGEPFIAKATPRYPPYY